MNEWKPIDYYNTLSLQFREMRSNEIKIHESNCDFSINQDD